MSESRTPRSDAICVSINRAVGEYSFDAIKPHLDKFKSLEQEANMLLDALKAVEAARYCKDPMERICLYAKCRELTKSAIAAAEKARES